MSRPLDLQSPGPTPDLQLLSDTTQMVLDTVRQLIKDRTVSPARVFTSRLQALVDELVSNLVPLMAAEELVLCQRVSRALGDPLREAHSHVRQSVERLNMLSLSVEPLSRRSIKTQEMLLVALQQMAIGLDAVLTHQKAVLCHLLDTLPLDEQARLAATIDAAAFDAREQTMLIVRPAIPPTAATVLRNRPDLNAAYALSVAEIERRLHRGVASEEEEVHVAVPPA